MYTILLLAGPSIRWDRKLERVLLRESVSSRRSRGIGLGLLLELYWKHDPILRWCQQALSMENKTSLNAYCKLRAEQMGVEGMLSVSSLSRRGSLSPGSSPLTPGNYSSRKGTTGRVLKQALETTPGTEMTMPKCMTACKLADAGNVLAGLEDGRKCCE